MTDPMRRLPTVRAPGATSNANISAGAGAGQAAAASAFRALADESRQLQQVYQPRMNDSARRQANEDLTNEEMQDRLALRTVVSQEDQVYNNTLRAGLLNRLNVEASGQSRELSAQFQYDEEGFNQAWSQYLSERVAELPEDIAAEGELLLMQYADRASTSIRLETRSRDTEQAIEAIQQSFELNQEQIHTLIENNPAGYMEMPEYQQFEADRNALLVQMAGPQFGLSEVEIERVRDAALFQEQEVVALGALDQTVASEGFPAAYDQITEISNSMQLSGEERSQFEGRLNSHLRRQEARANAERVQMDRERIQRERALSDAQNRRYHQFRVQMADGQLSRDAIDAAFEAAEISDAHWSTLILGSASDNAERVENQAILESIAGGAIPADPQNRDHRDAVDMAFQDIMRELGGVSEVANDPSLMRSVAVSTLDQFSIVPPAMQSMVRGHIASGSPEQVGPALDLVSTLAEMNPAAARHAFGETLGDAAVYADSVFAGVPPEEATANYLRSQEARLNPAADGMREAAEDISDRFSTRTIEEALDSNPLPFVGRSNLEEGTPEAVAAVARYQRLFSDAYIRYGNERSARTFANEAFQRVYGRTVVDGRERLMAYPPENHYPDTRGGSQWMQEQLRLDVQDLLGDGVSNVRLVADGVTASEAQAGVPPSYIVTYLDENGVAAHVPERYRFDAARHIESLRGDLQAEQDRQVSRGREARRQLLAGIDNRNAELQERAVREWLMTDAGGGQQALSEFEAWRRENPNAPVAEFTPLIQHIVEPR